jgi:glycosyltransferase involved in cell wall biosynthesis
MAERLVTNQPYIVFEGIASDFPFSISQQITQKKTIVYAGTLNERFGVMRLVDAFMKIKNENYESVICGIGDSQEKIIECSKIDSRINYKGQLKRENVLEELSKATVIVNPRPDGEEFTKYSFPSKNLEALSSGIPFVGYKLAGIGDEYDEFINYPTDSTIESLANLLIDVCSDVNGIYRTKAILAKKWVSENKNQTKQAAKIVKMLSERE